MSSLIAGLRVRAARFELSYLLKRFLLVFPTMLSVLAIVFFFTRVIGNPVSTALGDRISQEELERRIHSLGYDRPVFVQFVEFLGQILKGDFGSSVHTGEPVIQIIWRYLPPTIELSVMSVLLAFPISMWLGKVAFRTQGSIIDGLIRITALFSYAVPVFLVAIFLRLLFSIFLGWLPASGRASLENEILLGNDSTGKTGFYFFDSILLGSPSMIPDLLAHSILPVISLALALSGTLIRTTRSAYLNAAKTPVVQYAFVMGFNQKVIEREFIAKQSRSEIISVYGLAFASVVTGVIFTETAFEWRGLGYALNHFIGGRDFDVVQGLTIALSFIVVLVHSTIDWLARIATPKVSRFQGQ